MGNYPRQIIRDTHQKITNSMHTSKMNKMLHIHAVDGIGDACSQPHASEMKRLKFCELHRLTRIEKEIVDAVPEITLCAR